MNATISFIKQTLKHKYYVYKYGRMLWLSRWQLLIHDLSKFTSIEIKGYTSKFFSDDPDEKLFSYAWHHHMSRNPHHWGHWLAEVPPKYQGTLEHFDEESGTLEMPPYYASEMVVDWMAASMTHSNVSEMTSKGLPDISTWLNVNFANLRLHRNTREFVIKLLFYEFGYKYDYEGGTFYAA